MKGKLIKCIRCDGRKKLFTMNGGYSHTNTGGVQVDCPMCLGNGTIQSLADVLEDVAVARKSKTDKPKNRDIDEEPPDKSI